ncbi:MAG: hypothetical protein ABW172_11550 [Candidatus Binatia bacterium]
MGTIFANDHRPNPSIVFLHRTQFGKVEGATLRDTRHQSSFCPCLGYKLTAWFAAEMLNRITESRDVFYERVGQRNPGPIRRTGAEQQHRARGLIASEEACQPLHGGTM